MVASDEVCRSDYLHIQLVIVIRVQSEQKIQVLFLTKNESLRTDVEFECQLVNQLTFVKVVFCQNSLH